MERRPVLAPRNPGCLSVSIGCLFQLLALGAWIAVVWAAVSYLNHQYHFFG